MDHSAINKLSALFQGISCSCHDPRTRRAIPPTQEAAYELTHELMALSDPPSALFALTGTMAIGSYRALRERRLRIPDDVSLLAFDDYPWTSLVEPGIDVLYLSTPQDF